MVTQLGDGVWWVDLQGVNAYLVEDGDTMTLVDAGMPWQRRRLEGELTTIVDTLADIERVLVTHQDFDHVGALDRVADLDATVYVGVEDEPYLAGREAPTWTSPKGAFQRLTGTFRDGISLPIETVGEGDTVGGFTAYHTPGHTPGHTAFVNEDLSVAFLGDLVRERDGAFRRPPRLLNVDHDRAGESIAEYVDRAPSVEMGCPGHGRPVVDGATAALAACAEELRAEAVGE